MRRRDFLGRALGATAGLVGAAGGLSGAAAGSTAGLAPSRRSLSRATPLDGDPGVAAQFPPPRLDAHAHVNSVNTAERVNRLTGAGTLEPLAGADLVERMGADGIERALVLSTAYLSAMDAVEEARLPEAEERAAVELENDFCAAECARFPERLIPFCSVNPKRPWAREEVDRCVDLHGMRGVKFHFWNSVVDLRGRQSLDALAVLFGHLADRGLPAVIHVFNGSVSDFGPDDVERFLVEVVRPHPGLRVSFAHAGGAGGLHPRIAQIFRRLTEVAPLDSDLGRRLWIDISAVMFTSRFKTIPPTAEASRALMGELLSAWGAERTLWGSDTIPDYVSQTEGVWPLSDAEWAIVAAHDGARFLGG